MDKIKKIFSPGHKEDDDTMYNSGNQNTTSGTTGSHTTGSHATGSHPTGSSTTGTGEGYSLNSDPLYANSSAGNESGLKRQILNPGNDKYDSNRFDDSTGGTSSTNPSSTLGSRPTATGTASTASIRSGVVGADQPPPSLSTDTQAPDYSSGNTGASNTSNLPDRTATGTHDSHLGRDSAIAGDNSRSFPLGGNSTSGNTTGTHDSHLGRDAAVAGGVGAAGYEAEKHHHGHHGHHEPTSTSGNTGLGSNSNNSNFGLGSSTNPSLGSGSNTTGTHDSHLGRDAGLAGGVGAAGYEAEKHHHGHHGHNDPTGTSTGLGSSGNNTGLGSSGNHTGLGSSGNTTGTHNSHLGRDAALAGGVGAAGYEAEKHHHHHNGNTGSALHHDSETPVEGYVHHVSGPHATDIANRLDPHVGGEALSSGHQGHHLGRETAVAGGVGAAGLGAHESDKHHHHNTSSSQPLSGTSSTHDRDHHLGRDAALAGGAGAAGLGAHEAGKHHHGHHEAGGFDDQRYDPTSTSGSSHGLGSGQQGSSIGYPSSTSNTSGTTGNSHLGRDAALAGGAGAGAAGLAGHESSRGNTGASSGSFGHFVDNKVDPRINPQAADSQKQHHYGRDAALAGGAGAVGTGAYEAEKHHHSGATGHNTQPGSSQVNTHGASTGVAGTDQSRDHHYGRDAAVAGGAGAAGLGAYELGKDHHDSSRLGAQSNQQPLATPTGAPRDARVFDQTHNVPSSNQAAAGWATDSKEQDKLAKQHDKELRKEEKHHDKALAKEEKKEEKLERKEEKREEKAEKKEEKREEKAEKKGGLLGFLHHDKTHDKTHDENVRSGNEYRDADESAHLRHQQQLERDAAAGTAGTAGVAGAAYEPSLRDQHSSNIGTDASGHNRLHKDPPARVQQELDQRAYQQGSGLTGSSGQHIPESAIGSGNDAHVTDPHTGLPMNVGKYGRGTGGTDASNTVPGYQN